LARTVTPLIEAATAAGAITTVFEVRTSARALASM